MEEFEIKFLEVDVPNLEKKLIEVGANKIADLDYTRTIFYFPDKRRGEWLRLRTDGKETTLTYKKFVKKEADDDGMVEIEVIVDDYHKTFELVKAMGFIVNKLEKNKRIRYEKKDVIYDIDFWPGIPPYVEIESTSYEMAREAAKELGFEMGKEVIGSAGSVYMKYGIDIDEYSSITFEGMVKK